MATQNIGELTKNDNGFYTGKIETLATGRLVIALRPNYSDNPNAPRFDMFARARDGGWVRVGALWEKTATESGEAFLQGHLDDPSMDKRLYVACFMREDGSYAIAWSRPQRQREDLPQAVRGDDAAQAASDFDGNTEAPAKGRAKKATADLGETTSDAVPA